MILSKKTLLLLSSIALLASCTTGVSSSTNPFFSSGSGEATSSKSSLPYAPTDQANAKAAFIEAFDKSAKNDKIGLRGAISADGEFSGKLAVDYEGGKPVRANQVRGKINGKYDLALHVVGLRQGAFGYALDFSGSHQVEYGMGEEILTNQYQGAAGMYGKDGNAYFNIDDKLAPIMEALMGYPYQPGKVYVEDAFNGMPSPLLDDETVKKGKEGLGEALDHFLEQAGQYLDFLKYQDSYRVEAKVTPATLSSLAARFAQNEEASMVFYLLGKADVKDTVVTIDYDTKVGFQSIYLNLDLNLQGAVKDIFPKESGYPDIIANEPVKAFAKAHIALDFDYGVDPTFPSDLSTYEPAQGGQPSRSSDYRDRTYVTIDEVAKYIANIKDPKYNTLYVESSTGEVQEFHEGEEGWTDYYTGAYHLTQELLMSLKESKEFTPAFYFTKDGSLHLEITDLKRAITIEFTYPTNYYNLYADAMKSTIGDSYLEAHFKWTFEPTPGPQPSQTAEETSSSEPSIVILKNEGEFIDFVNEASFESDYNALAITFSDGETQTIDASSSLWEQLTLDYNYHLTPDGALDLLKQVHDGPYSDAYFALDYDANVLRVVLVNGDASTGSYQTLEIEYDLDDGLYARSQARYNVEKGSPSLIAMAKLSWGTNN